VVGEGVEIRGRGQIGRCRIALEVERLGADAVQQRGRDGVVEPEIELLDVFGEDRRGRGDVRPDVGELGAVVDSERDLRRTVIRVFVPVGFQEPFEPICLRTTFDLSYPPVFDSEFDRRLQAADPGLSAPHDRAVEQRKRS